MQIYHVETQEDYDALMEELEKDGTCSFNENVWTDDREKTCIRVNERTYSYDSIDWFTKHYPGALIQKYKAKQSDVVNSPNHYKQGERETIENIRDTMSSEGYQGYCVGNVVKYLARYKFKNGLEDVKKAKKYIEFLEEELMKQED